MIGQIGNQAVLDVLLLDGLQDKQGCQRGCVQHRAACAGQWQVAAISRMAAMSCGPGHAFWRAATVPEWFTGNEDGVRTDAPKGGW